MTTQLDSVEGCAGPVAVIGAGIAGLTCAREIAAAGIPVVVFDKSRGTAGRMSTRRTDVGARFDHGAQYFTARDERFQSVTESWKTAGVVAEWTGRIVEWGHGEVLQQEPASPRLVGVPGMNAIGKHLADGLPVRTGLRIESVTRHDDRWQLQAAEGPVDQEFAAVIVAVPAVQAVSLLGESPALADAAKRVSMAPCWAVMIGFSQPIGFDADAAFVHNSAISWIACNSSKPDRNDTLECWVLHASAEWSEQNIDRPAKDVASDLLAEFQRITGCTTLPPVHLVAHRWMYATATTPLNDGCLFDAANLIGACGDWCSGNRVEAAFLSGLTAAERLLQRFAQSSDV